MLEGGNLLSCPSCGSDLLQQDHKIFSSQVTLDYGIVGNLQINCKKCWAEIGPFLTEQINNYSWFIKVLFGLGPTNVYPDLVRFVEALQEALDSLPPRPKGGKLPWKEALEKYFGLNGQARETQKKIANDAGVTKEAARQVIDKAIRMLRHPSRSRTIRRWLYQSPNSIAGLV
jgi:hypothetical protein